MATAPATTENLQTVVSQLDAPPASKTANRAIWTFTHGLAKSWGDTAIMREILMSDPA